MCISRDKMDLELYHSARVRRTDAPIAVGVVNFAMGCCRFRKLARYSLCREEICDEKALGEID